VRGVAISRHVATVSWRLLSRDRELLAVPVIATAAFTAVAVPGVLLLGRSGAARTNEVGFWLVLVAAGVLAAGVVARSPSSAARGGSTRRVLGRAALAGVLSFAGRRAEERLGIGGRVLARAARTTVDAISVVAQPAIVRTTRVRPVPSVALLLVPAAAVVIAGVVAMGAIPVEVVVVILAGSWTAVVLAVTSVLAGGRAAPVSRGSGPAGWRRPSSRWRARGTRPRRGGPRRRANRGNG
jgi:hypothetical protein